MKIRIQILLAALALVIVANSTHAAGIVWTNTAGGNWSDTNSWSPNQVPGADDIAVITNDASYTVTLDASFSVGGLMLGTSSGVNTQILLINGQTLTLNGTAVVGASGTFTLNSGVLGGNVILNGALACSGGTLSGAMTITSNSMLTAASPGMSLNGMSLTNYGTVNWSSGNINCDSSPQIYNYNLWNAQADGTFSGQQNFGSTTFNNYGTFSKSGGSGTTTVDANTTFNTSGTVDVQTGTVQIEGGGGGGVLNVAGGATASFDNRFTFIGGTLFTGAGTVGGYLIGSDAVLSGTLNCSGNALSGTLTVASNSVLNLGALTVTLNGPGCILTNYGTVNWSSGNINCDSSPQIYNYNLWNAQADGTFSGQQNFGSTTFNNYGTFSKSGGSGTTTVDANTTFNTSGTVDVQTGTVQIEGGGGGGVLNVAGGATASFDNRFTFIGGTLFTGAGTVGGYLIGSDAVLSGTLNCSGNALSGTLTVASNSVLNLGALTVTLNGPGCILTNYGTVNWSSGNINCDSSPQIYNYNLWNAQADGTFSGQQNFGSTTFNNYGTFSKSGGSGTTTVDANTTFNTSGTVDVQTGTVQIEGGGGGGVLNVAGGATASFDNRFTFIGGTLFTGAGTVGGYLIGSDAVLSGTLNCSGNALSGTLTVASNSVLNIGTSGLTVGSPNSTFLTNYGTVNWSSGDINCNNSPQIYNYGLWSILSDNTFSGGSSTATTFNNLGIVRKSTATNTTTFGDFLNFINTGTVDTQSGALNFTINPALTGGTLNFGINSSNSFGKINLPSGAPLAGTVSANLNNLFAPGTNNSFAVLTYASHTGTFTGTNLPAGFVWQPVYGSTAFSLDIASIVPAQLAAVTQSGGTFSFSFGAVPGQIYQIQTTTNLAPANWIDLGGTIQATNSSLTVFDAINGNPQLFYRAVLQ